MNCACEGRGGSVNKIEPRASSADATTRAEVMKSDESANTNDHSGAARTPRAVWVGAALLVLLTAVMAGLPVLAGLISVLKAREIPWGMANGAELLTRTVLVSGLIATGATLLGLPAAFVLARRSPRGWGAWVGVLVVSVLFLPAYLPYAGLSAARAPTTMLGDVLSHWSPDAIVLVGRWLAVGGLMLAWWPLSAVLMAEGLRSSPPGLRDAMAMDGASGLAIVLTRIRLARGWLLGAWALVFVYGTGSAIPLHLAQIQTFSIALWRGLDSSPDVGGTIAGSWPLVAVAGASAWALTRKGALKRPSEIGERVEVRGRAGGGWGTLAAVLVWAISMPIPLLLLAGSIKNGSVAALGERAWRLWQENTDAVLGSAATGALVAIGTAGLAGVTAYICSTGAIGQRVTRVVLGLFIMLALVPGMIVGCCVRLGWELIGPAADGLTSSPGVVALAHLARFGFVGVAAGLALAGAEPAEQRAMRVLDGATGVWGWLRVQWAQTALGIGGAALCGFALSVGEIESTVILQPPGSESLARLMLERLHFLKDQDLAAAGVTIALLTMAAGVVVAIVTRSIKLRSDARSGAV